MAARGSQSRLLHTTRALLKRKGGNKAFDVKRTPASARRKGPKTPRHEEHDHSKKRFAASAPDLTEVSLAMIDEGSDSKFAEIVEDLLSPLGQTELPGWPDLRRKDPDALWSSIRHERGSKMAKDEDLLRSYAYLIRVLCSHGRFTEAFHVVWRLEVGTLVTAPNDLTYGAILHGAAICNRLDASNEVWRHMESFGIEPNSVQWSTRLLAQCRCGAINEALKSWERMQKSGTEPALVHFTIMMNGCVGKGRVDEAWQILRQMIMAGIEPDVMTYTVMIKACSKDAAFEKAMGLMEEMELRQILPTRYTFNALLRAASTAPLWMRAYGGVIDVIRRKMEGYDLPPNEATFCALLECYGKGGDSDSVVKTIEELQAWCEDVRRNPAEHTHAKMLVALARCASSGEVLGAKPRYGSIPQQAESERKLREDYRQVVVSTRARRNLEALSLSGLIGSEEVTERRLPKRQDNKRIHHKYDEELRPNEDDEFEEARETQMLADMIISQEEEAYHIAAGNSLNVHPSSSSELIRLEEADRNQQVAPSTAELMKLPRQERLNRLEDLAVALYWEAVECHGLTRPIATAMLDFYAEALKVDKAEAFFQSEYLSAQLQITRSEVRSLVRMYCRSRRLDDALELERVSRTEWGILADKECLGMILNEAAKRNLHDLMSLVLDICNEEGCVPREFWLIWVRKNERSGRFSHPALPPDPKQHVRNLSDLVRRQPNYSPLARVVSAKLR